MIDSDIILEKIIKLAKNWHETEQLTGDEVWGECATDLDNLIDDLSEEM